MSILRAASSGTRLSRLELLALALCLLVGAALRVAYLGEIRESPSFRAPGVDAGFHDYWARGLATGHWAVPAGDSDPGIAERPYFRPPGYPYFLAAVYALSGGSYTAPRVLQMLLGLLAAIAAFAFARSAFGRRAALLTAAGMSVYWAFIYFEGELQAAALFVFLLLVLLNLLRITYDRPSGAVAFAGGAVCGLAALVRPNALAVLAASGIWIVWVAHRGTPRRKLRDAALLLLGASLAILPATLRNVARTGEWVVISSNTGINLYIGNNPKADGLVSTEIEGLGRFRTCFDWPAIVDRVGERLGHPTSDAEASSYFARQAWRYVREHPAAVAALTWRKARLFWGPDEVGHNKEIHYDRRFSAVLRTIPGSFPAVLSLAVLGLVLLTLERRAARGADAHDEVELRRRRELALLLVLLALAYFVSVLPFFAAARYRLPVVPFLILLAAAAVDRLLGLVAARRLLAASLAAIALLATYLLVTRPVAGYAPSLPRWHFDLGTDYERIGRPDLAAEQYERALAVDPSFFEAHYNLGHKLRDRGEVEAAIAQWEAAVRLDPTYAPAHYNLALAYRDTGSTDRAISEMQRAAEADPSSARYRLRLGDLLVAAGRTREALARYEEVLGLDPLDVEALRNAAWILAVHPDPAVRDPRRAVALAERAAARSGGDSPSVLDALAAAYASAGRYEEAEDTARDAAAAARASGNEELARRIEQRLVSYRKASRPASTKRSN